MSFGYPNDLVLALEGDVLNKMGSFFSCFCLLTFALSLGAGHALADDQTQDIVIMKVDASENYESEAKQLLESIQAEASANKLKISPLSGQFSYSEMHAMTECGKDTETCNRMVAEYSGTQQIIFATIATDGKEADLTWYRIGSGVVRQLTLPISNSVEISFAANAILLGEEGVKNAFLKGADKIVFIDVDTDTDTQNQLFYQIKLAIQRNMDKRDVTVSLAPYKRSEVETVAACDSNLEECMHTIAEMSDAEEIILGDVNDTVYHLIWYSTKSGVKGESFAQISSNEEAVDLAERLVLEKLVPLEVVSKEVGVEVFIDGLLYGVTMSNKQSFRIPYGPHELVFRKRGAYSVQMSIDAQKPQEVNVNFDMMPISPVEKGLKYSGYALMASGVVVGLTGVYFATEGKKINENPQGFLDELDIDSKNEPRGNNAKKHEAAVMAKYNVANALFGVGAGLAVVGITLTILGHSLDFHGDPDAQLSSWIPKVDMDFSSESTHMTLGWTF